MDAKGLLEFKNLQEELDICGFTLHCNILEVFIKNEYQKYYFKNTDEIKIFLKGWYSRGDYQEYLNSK